MLFAIACGSRRIVPIAASAITSTSTPSAASVASVPRRSCRVSTAGSGWRDRSTPSVPRVRGAKKLYVTRPRIIPTPAAPKPRCQPYFSPSNPVTIWPAKAPRLIPM